MNKRVRTFLLIAVLLFAAIGLSGCGIPTGDINLDVPPGWWEAIFVYPLAKFMIFLDGVFRGVGIPYSYGWAIIILTLLIKVVTLPLTLKQLQSSKTMVTLQPRLKELQEKYGKDKQKLSEEQMKLYKEGGANPLGGCLPLVIQMPVMIALYQSLYVLANPSIGKLQGAGFFWIADLSFPHLQTGMNWIAEFFTSGQYGKLISYLILPIITLASSFVQQKMAQQPKDPKGSKQDPQAQAMGQMMVFMPLMFGWFSLTVPAGLVLYWVTSTILSIIPQYFVTGWGGLVDWFPMLRRGDAAQTAILASSKAEAKIALAATKTEVPATTDQPSELRRPIIKRRTKRRK